jgi:hypothetical protein
MNPVTAPAAKSATEVDEVTQAFQASLAVSTPATTETLVARITKFQAGIDDCNGDLREIDRLTDDVWRDLNEIGGAIVQAKPNHLDVMLYLKFIIDFYVADYLVGRLIEKDPAAPYSHAEQLMLHRALVSLDRAEASHIPFTQNLAPATSKNTYIFYSLWRLEMRALCWIGLNMPSAIAGYPCTCCAGLQLVSELSGALDQNFALMDPDGADSLKPHLINSLKTIAQRGESQRHQGPCPILVMIRG